MLFVQWRGLSWRWKILIQMFTGACSSGAWLLNVVLFCGARGMLLLMM